MENKIEKLLKVVKENDGYVGFKKNITINLDGEERICKALVLKYSYEDGNGHNYMNLVVIDSNFENWDVDDYVDDNDLELIIQNC